LSGFARVVTHPKVFKRPSSAADAFAFAQQLRDQPNCVRVEPGPRHWDLFRRLCLDAGVKGNLVPDAYLAAIAIESGCEWISTDRDFSRFSGLRWRHPSTESFWSGDAPPSPSQSTAPRRIQGTLRRSHIAFQQEIVEIAAGRLPPPA
jgi:hypothetical protein